MTPLDCIYDIVGFLQEEMQVYQGRNNEDGKPVSCYAGFLPYAMHPKEKKGLCPAVAVRYEKVIDGENETIVSVAVFVTDYDEDIMHGADSMFHMLEYIRQRLLINNPILMKYQIKNGTMETTVPEEQPYPQWWGRIDFDVHLPQPEKEWGFLL
jgi:hypothetical protein